MTFHLKIANASGRQAAVSDFDDGMIFQVSATVGVLPGAAIPSHSNNVGLIHSVPHPYQSHSRPAYYPRHMRKEKVSTSVKCGHGLLQAATGLVYMSQFGFIEPRIMITFTGKYANKRGREKCNTHFTHNKLFP
jgi:hypothetical protein